MKKHLLPVLFLSCLYPLHATDDRDTFGKSFFFPRSQGTGSMRDANNLVYYRYPFMENYLHGYYGWTLQYQRSFNEKKLAEYLFFNETDTMTFGNAGTQNVDVFGRNFILNDDFEGTVRARPRIESVIMDQQIQLNLGQFSEKLYMTVNAPIAWTKFDMQLEEMVSNTGTNIPANILGNPDPEQSPFTSIVEAWKGNVQLQGFYPDVKRPLENARVNGPQTKGSLIQLEYAVGYYAFNKPDAHLGIEARIVIPTGNRPDGEFFFEPLAGNGRHFQLGVGIQGHLEMVDYGGFDFTIYGVARAYHMFGADQKRTFDLQLNGVGSRYLLLKKFNNDGTYAGEIEFGPNVLTLPCTVKVPLLIDGTVLAVYDWGNFSFVAGYTVWARTSESITITGEIERNTYGVQGNTPTAGANSDTTASSTRINGQFADSFDANPRFINVDDLNRNSATHPASYSQRGSLHVAYNWEQNPYNPYLLAGIFAELSGSGNHAMDQGGIFMQAGLSYN